MKKIFICAMLATLMISRATAQRSADSIKVAEQNGHKLNTGTLQDIVNNYLQVAAKNITGTNSSLQMKINWFALNTMDSVHKYENTNFIKTAWQRNGEFVLSGGVDKDNKINSFQAGLNYNFLNRRDTAASYDTAAYIDYYPQEGIIRNNASNNFQELVAKVIEPKLYALILSLYAAGNKVNDLKSQMTTAIPGIFPGKSSDQAIADTLQDLLNKDIGQKAKNGNNLSSTLSNKIHLVSIYEGSQAISIPLNDYFAGYGKTPLKFPPLITSELSGQLTKYLNDQVKSNKVLHGKLGANTLEDVNKKVMANYDELLKYVSRQPLLTFSYLYTYGTGTVLNSHVGGFTYLQGLGSFRTTKVGQLNISLTDTLTASDPTGKIRNLNRNIIAFQGGYNQVLVVQKKVSILELNVALEEDRASEGYVSKTDKSKFYLDAYFKARLPTTPWLKFDFKYDPKAGNLLGFLDFTYNLDKQ